MELLGHRVDIFHKKLADSFPEYLSSSQLLPAVFESFSYSTSLPKFDVVILFNLAIPGGVKLCLILVLTCISLKT